MLIHPCLLLVCSIFSMQLDPIKVTASSGPIQIEVRKVSNVLDFASGSRHTRLQLGLSWKEGFKPILLDSMIQGMEVKAHGKQVFASKPTGAIWMPVESLDKATVEAVLPHLGGREIDFSGAIRVIVPMDWKDLDLGSLKQALAKLDSLPPVLGKNGFSTRVSKLTETPNRISIQVDTKLPSGGPELDTNQNWAILNELNLIGPGEAVLKAQGQVVDLLESDRAVITYHFIPKSGRDFSWEGWRIRYQTPGMVEKKELPFLLKAVPLP